jgi:hypothetical protein
MEIDWTEDLTPDEAQAALDALNAIRAPRRDSETEKGARGQAERKRPVTH